MFLKTTILKLSEFLCFLLFSTNFFPRIHLHDFKLLILTIDTYFQSHPACRGPDFVKASFNLNGRSPLVAHFLRMRNLTADLNNVIRVQRTEIDNLPPYPFNESYGSKYTWHIKKKKRCSLYRFQLICWL